MGGLNSGLNCSIISSEPPPFWEKFTIQRRCMRTRTHIVQHTAHAACFASLLAPCTASSASRASVPQPSARTLQRTLHSARARCLPC